MIYTQLISKMVCCQIINSVTRNMEMKRVDLEGIYFWNQGVLLLRQGLTVIHLTQHP